MGSSDRTARQLRTVSHFQGTFDAFNRNGKLPHYELVIYYARIRHLVLDSALLLLSEGFHLQHHTLKTISRFITKMNHHRKVMKRSVMSLPSEQLTDGLLSTSMDLLEATMHGNVAEQRLSLHRLVLSRAEYVTLLEALRPTIRQYLAWYNEALKLRLQNKSVDSLLSNMRDLVAPLGFDPDTVYGLFRALERRFVAMEAVEHLLFGFYGRILAKNAKKIAPRKDGSVMDTLQDGAEGLRHAIRTYDHVSRRSFSSHVDMWTKQRIYYYMKRTLNTVLPNPGIWQQKITHDKQRQKHEQKFGPLPLTATPLDSTLKPSQIAKVYEHMAMLQTIPTDAPALAGEEDYLERSTSRQSILTEDEDQLRDDSSTAANRKLVHSILSRCSDSERTLLSLRFGIADTLPSRPLAPAIALRERIRQQYAKAVKSAS